MNSCGQTVAVPVSTMRKVEQEAKNIVENIYEDIIYRSMNLELVDIVVCRDHCIKEIFTKTSSWTVCFMPQISKFTARQINSGMSGLIIDKSCSAHDGSSNFVIDRFNKYITKVLSRENEFKKLIDKRSFEAISELYKNKYNFIESRNPRISFVRNGEKSEFEPYLVVEVQVERLD